MPRYPQSAIISLIDFLQDQLNLRNLDLKDRNEQVYDFHLKLADMEMLAEEMERLKEQMKISETERLLVMQEEEVKEVLINYSASRVEKLEELISSMGLEYQCEIESMKLELVALEQNLFETKKLLDERTQENSRMIELIQDLEHRFQGANGVIESLKKENEDMKKKIQAADMNANAFVQKVEEQFPECLGKMDSQSSSKLEKDMSAFDNVLGPLFSGLAIPRSSDADLRNKIAEMSHQIDEYELITRQLKEELRKERLRAKEEAEDLAQEMAELRYQLTSVLDEERKRRASIEQISLHRIVELEAQIAKERCCPGRSFHQD